MLTPDEREALFEAILATSQVGIATISHAEIDSINIRQASLRAMCRALAALPCVPDIALVDGNDPPDLPCDIETIVKGDARIAFDRRRLDRRQGGARPHDETARRPLSAYGFGTNVGYGTAVHLSALAAEGPCPFHRTTFAPVRGAA